MKQRIMFALRCAAMIGIASAWAAGARAQSGGSYDLSWSTIDGGGVTSTSGGTYEIASTTGQPDAGRLAGGSYVWGGGFWGGGAALRVDVLDLWKPATGTVEMGLCRPNPFFSSAAVQFAVPTPQRVQLEVFDLRGRRIRTLLDEVVPAGRHSVAWDGTDATHRHVDSGIYLVRLATAGVSLSRKLAYLRNH